MATVQTAWDLFSTLEARKLPTVKGTDAQGVSYTIKLAAPLKGATYEAVAKQLGEQQAAEVSARASIAETDAGKVSVSQTSTGKSATAVAILALLAGRKAPAEKEPRKAADRNGVADAVLTG